MTHDMAMGRSRPRTARGRLDFWAKPLQQRPMAAFMVKNQIVSIRNEPNMYQKSEYEYMYVQFSVQIVLTRKTLVNGHKLQFKT